MKLKILSLCLMLISALAAFSQTPPTVSNKKTPVALKVTPKRISDKILRAPIKTPIEVLYDPFAHTIEIIGGEEIEGEVFIYLNECIIESRSEINGIYNIPASTGSCKVRINTTSYDCEAEFLV